MVEDAHMADESTKPRKLLSIQGFALATGLSERMVKKAIELGEIRVVTFAGRELIPPSEADRVKALTE